MQCQPLNMNSLGFLCNEGSIILLYVNFFVLFRIEAVYCGCYPLVPNDLVYPEIYPEECLYKDDGDLYERLEYFCKKPSIAANRRRAMNIDFKQYSAEHLLPKYLEIFNV